MKSGRPIGQYLIGIQLNANDEFDHSLKSRELESSPTVFAILGDNNYFLH